MLLYGGKIYDNIDIFYKINLCNMIGSVVAMLDPRGIIVNYHIAYTKEILVDIPGIKSKREAGKFIGKKAVWADDKGNKYIGIVSGLHGRKGTLKIKFKKPLPAKALARPINVAE
jgi:large subunit ribosomal protein L35Ae